MNTVPVVDETDEAPGTTTVGCPQCTAKNPPQRKFCAQCGAPLWVACLQCGALCAGGENFCGACGANLVATVQQHLDRFAADLREVEQMRREGRFDDAIALLEKLAQVAHPQLKDQAAQAARLVGRLAAQRDRSRIVVEEAAKSAEASFAAHDYAAAARLLEHLPGPLRTAAMQQMLLEAKTRVETIDRLSRDLQEARRTGAIGHVLAAINQLLALQPDHAEARSTADRFQQQVCEAAQRRLAAFRYEQAAALLRRVPEAVRSAETAALGQQAAEWAWLAQQLRTAPVATPALAAMAARLQTSFPGDSQTAKLTAELNRRLKAPAARFPRVAVPWAAEARARELPVDWLTGFQRITLQEGLDGSPLSAHPGAFFVAAGLALQGLGQTPLEVNLLPALHHNLWGRLGDFLQVRVAGPVRSARSAWGIDLGSSALKAVKMTWDERERRAAIVALRRIEHHKPLDQVVNEAEETAVIGGSLEQLRGQLDLKSDRVSVGFPGRWAITRQLAVPPVSDNKFEALVRFEATQQFPLPLDLLAWGYQRLDHTTGVPAAKGGKSRGGKDGPPAAAASSSVFLAAVKLAQLGHRLDCFREAGIQVEVAQCDCLALHNFLAFEYLAGAEKGPAAGRTIAALDVGGDAANFVVAGPRCIWSRCIGLGGEAINRALVCEFHLTHAEAEQWKRSPAQAASPRRLAETIEPVMADLVREIQHSLAMFGQVHPGERIEELLLLGGGGCLHGLLAHLRQHL